MFANQGFAAENPPFVSDVEQGTYLAVNGEGVGAAAYTAAIGVTGMDIEEPIEVTLGRPFPFTLTGPNGAVLLVSIVDGPCG